MSRKLIIIIVGILVVFITVLFLVKGMSAKKEETEEIIPSPTVVLPTVSDDIKVFLTAKSGKQAVVLKISGIPADIESIEYELTYMTGSGLPRGVLGKINVVGENEIIRDDIVLGTCSSGRCVYDTGVSEVNLSLKFNSDKGSSVFQKVYQL